MIAAARVPSWRRASSRTADVSEGCATATRAPSPAASASRSAGCGAWVGMRSASNRSSVPARAGSRNRRRPASKPNASMPQPMSPPDGPMVEQPPGRGGGADAGVAGGVHVRQDGAYATSSAAGRARSLCRARPSIGIASHARTLAPGLEDRQASLPPSVALRRGIAGELCEPAPPRISRLPNHPRRRSALALAFALPRRGAGRGRRRVRGRAEVVAPAGSTTTTTPDALRLISVATIARSRGVYAASCAITSPGETTVSAGTVTRTSSCPGLPIGSTDSTYASMNAPSAPPPGSAIERARCTCRQS